MFRRFRAQDESGGLYITELSHFFESRKVKIIGEDGEQSNISDIDYISFSEVERGFMGSDTVEVSDFTLDLPIKSGHPNLHLVFSDSVRMVRKGPELTLYPK